MIALRFKAVVHVAGVAAAALSCYLVSLQVASERAQLMKAERQILAARADIRQLRTELGTRGRLVQLERWNADVLGLQAPKASQYAGGATQLASFVPQRDPLRVTPVALTAPTAAAAAAPRVVTVAAVPPAAAAPAPVVAPSPKTMHAVLPAPARLAPPRVVPVSLPAPVSRPRVVTVAYTPPPSQPFLQKAAWTPEPPRPAKKERALLDDDLLGDIGRAAKAEAKPTKRAPK